MGQLQTQVPECDRRLPPGPASVPVESEATPAGGVVVAIEEYGELVEISHSADQSRVRVFSSNFY